MSSGKPHVLQAKCKVTLARNKAALPKLELSTEVLLIKLMDRTVKALDVNFPKKHAWTDSTLLKDINL